mmetsp:Transcript_12221/g.26961  ORF Transcript_12221/g.26961 Transcript_12221/m.26961 type:complete len:434 (-) Transcript_12221:112-1413(-)
MDTVGHLTSHGNGRHFSNIFNASIGTGSDKHLFNGHSFQRLSFFQTNVFQRPRHGRLSSRVLALHGGNGTRHGRHILRRRSPRDGGGNIVGVNDDRLVVFGILVGHERFPIRHGLLPFVGIRCHGSALQIVKRHFVGGNNSRPSPRFNGHVGNGHASFHGQTLNGRTTKFNRIARTTTGTNHTDNVQHHILTRHAWSQFTIDSYQHVFGLGLGQGLRRQNVFHFARSNAKGQGPKGSVRGRVRITAHRDAAGQGKTLFGTDNVNNALSFVGKGEVGNVKILHVLFQLQDLGAGGGFLNKGFHVNELGTVRCGDIVIDRDEGAVRSTNDAVGHAKTFKGLGRRDFVDQVSIDVQQTTQTVVVDQVIVPDFVVQSAAGVEQRQWLLQLLLGGCCGRGCRRQWNKGLDRVAPAGERQEGGGAKSHSSSSSSSRSSG